MFKWGWIGCVRCEKFENDFMAQTCALIAPIQHCQMRPNTTRRTKTRVYGPMWWIGSIHYEKFRCNFMARTCALIAPVQPVLHRVSCINEILPNTPKHYEMHTNMILGSNGVDWMCLLQKNSKTTSWHKLVH